MTKATKPVTPEVDDDEYDQSVMLPGSLREDNVADDDDDDAENVPADPENAEPEGADVEDDDEGSGVEEEFETLTYKGKEVQKTRAEMRQLASMGFDYTQKTQALADKVRDYDARALMLAEREASAAKYTEAYGHLHYLDQVLNEYDKFDWSGVTDPLDFMKATQEHARIRSQRTELDTAIRQAQEQDRQKMYQFNQVQLQKAVNELQRDIPEWGEKLAGQLRSYALGLGASESRVSAMSDPVEVKILHKAYLYDKLKSGQSRKDKQIRDTAPSVKPGASNAKTTQTIRKSAFDKFRKSRSDADALNVLSTLI